MGIDANSVKSEEVANVVCNDKSDVWLLQEVGVAWNNIEANNKWEERARRASSQRQFGWFGNNERDNDQKKFQVGGVGVVLKKGLTSRKITQGKDPRGLGRWVWSKIRGREGKQVVFISAYRPVKGNTTGVNTANEQQVRGLAKDGVTEEPRENLLRELAQEICKWHEEGCVVILGMDANQRVRSNRMKKFADECGLIETITDLREGLPEQATCQKNSKNEAIDGLWITPSIQPIAGGYYEWSEKMSSDHVALWIEVDSNHLVGKVDTSSSPVIRSLLPTENKRLIKKYNKATTADQKKGKVLDQLRTLNSIPEGEWQQHHQESFERLMMEDIDRRKDIAKKLRKKYTGRKEWSPTLQKLRDQRRLWTLVGRRKKGIVVKSNQLKRLMNKTGIKEALLISAYEARQRKKQVDEEYRNKDKFWEAQRRNFLNDLDATNAKEKGISKASARKSRYATERLRKLGRKIARIKNKPKITVSKLYVNDADGNPKDLQTIREMEIECIKSNLKKFTQAQTAEACDEHLLERIGSLAEKEGAKEIMEGSFDTSNCSKFMKELIEELQVWHRQIKDKKIFTITKATHIQGWRKQKAQTSSDSRGLSYSHYKAAIADEGCAEVDSIFRNIPFRRGFSPKPWQKITDFQLLKKAGIFEVDLMRTIQLFLADFNMNNKTLGRIIMAASEALEYFPEELTGSRKRKKSALTILNKMLINDVWQMKRVIAALCSTDAKSCYDRVIHWIAMLSMRRIGVPNEPLNSLFKTIQKAVHSIAIENNLSKDIYDAAELKKPIHGLGQGNGAAPMIWVMVSAILVKILQKKGHGLQLISAISKTITSVTGFMFVDDLDLVEAFPSPWAEDTDVAKKMQGTVSRWAGTLRASGGKLEPSKSFWYLAKQSWTGTEWKYVATPDTAQLWVDNEDGSSVQITKLQAHEARETLGIFTALDGNHKKQIEKLKKATKTVSARYWKAEVTPSEMWEIFLSTLSKTWDYPKIAVSLSEKEWDSIISLIMPNVLNKAGVSSKIPRVLLYAPVKFHGFGLKHPFVDQHIQQIECLLTELQQESFTGKLITHAIEQLKLEIGIDGTLSSMDWDHVNKYCTPSWLTALFTFAAHHKITIKDPTPQLLPLRKHDQFIMKMATKLDLSAVQLRQLNNIRQSLQVSRLSEVSDLDGTRIVEEAWQGKCSPIRQCNLEWPRTGEIGDKDIKIWTLTLCHFTGSPHKRRLKQPLGTWFVQPKTRWMYSHASGRLYKECNLMWKCYISKRKKRQNNAIFQALASQPGSSPLEPGFPIVDRPQAQDTRTIPPDAFYVNGREMEHGVLVHFPQKQQEVEPVTMAPWWDEGQFYWRWTGDDRLEQTVQCLEANQLIIVSDGSYKENHATAAFVMESRHVRDPLITRQVIVPGATEQLSPFRAEVLGVLSAIAWVENCTETHKLQASHIHCGFDNEAGFKRLTNPTPMAVRQADFDIINAIKSAVRLSNHKWTFFWVRGHQDEVKDVLTQEEHMNVISDALAKECWNETKSGSRNNNWTTTLERVGLFLDGQKMTEINANVLYEHCSIQKVKTYWNKRHDLSPIQWQQIDWTALDKAMKSLPPGARRWTSKHWAGFSATGRVMCRRQERSHNKCPFCCRDEEDAEHLFLCQDEKATTHWENEKATTFLQLERIKTDPEILRVLDYIWPPNVGRPLVTQQWMSSSFTTIFHQQLQIGFMNLFRGRVSKLWVDQQHRWLTAQATRWKRSTSRWAGAFVKHILNAAWNIWQLRNEYLHSEQHPWNQQKIKTIQHQIVTLSAQPTDFLETDHLRVQRWSKSPHEDTLDDAQKRLDSIKAAQLRKRQHSRSLRPQRLLMARWLKKTNT